MAATNNSPAAPPAAQPPITPKEAPRTNSHAPATPRLAENQLMQAATTRDLSKTSAKPAAEADEAAREARAKRQRETQQDFQGRYIVKDGEYRFKANPAVVAFRDDGKRLSTELDRPAVAKSVVAAAEMKGWKAMRVAGTEEFKREAWIEASVRGIKAVGYEPTKADHERVAQEKAGRLQNRIEPLAQRAAAPEPTRHAAVALMERHLAQQKDLTPELRARVVAEGQARTAQLAEAGTTLKVRVFDPNAQRTVAHPVPQFEPHRDRGARTR